MAAAFSLPLHWYRIQGLFALKGKISNESVLLKGSDEIYINYFLFYFENVAKEDIADAEREPALILYLRGPFLHFFYEKLATDGEMTAEATTYSTVKKALLTEFKKD